MHTENRRKIPRTGTHPSLSRSNLWSTRNGRRRAFTLIELGVAVLIFTLIAGVATLAVARAQLSAAKDRFERSAEAELNALLAVVATGAYDNLVDGNFLRPEPCVEAAHLSCPTVHGRTLTVAWEITGIADPTGTSTENLAGVLVGVSTTLPFGDTLERERFVTAANAGSEDTTLVRVSLSGQTYDGPIYLITDTGTVAGSAIAADMTALIRSDVASCTSAAPCRLALRPDGDARDDTVTLDHLAVSGDGIVLDADIVFETGAILRPIRELHVLLMAENADGRRAWADATGSVCLYLSIPTPDGVIEEPACNTESPERVIWRTYHPDRVGLPDVTVALPADVDMAVLTDPDDAVCDAPGQTGWSAGAWAASNVCTGWTWGEFAELRDGLTGSGSVAATTRLEPGTADDAQYTAVWTAGTGAPASGHADGALWEKPRDVPACAATDSCTAPSGNPDSACPNGYCNSSRPSAPVLLEPRRGTYKVPVVAVTAGVGNTFTVVVADTEDDSITVTIGETVSGLTHDDETILDGDTIADEIDGPVALEFEIEPVAGFTSDTLTITLSDGIDTRDVAILVTAVAPAAHTVITGPVTIRQNDTETVRILVVDEAGEPASGAGFTYTAPAGVTMGTPAEVVPGVYTSVLAATGGTATGNGTYTLNAGPASDTTAVVVTGKANSVAIEDTTAQQGADGTLTATVTDANGAPVADAHVWFSMSAGSAGTVPLGTYPAARGCVTDATGTCDVDLTVEQNATTGTFTVTGHSGDATGTADVTVTSSIAKIVSDGIELEQGSTAAITFTAFSGRNEPAAGIPFTASVTATGASVTASGTTDADGKASIDVTAGTSTPTGELVVTIDDGANQHPIRIEVLSTVTSVDAPGTIDAAQYGNGTVTVTARNGQGVPVPYAVLELAPDTGIFAPDSVVTGPSGTATIAFTVGTDTPLGTKNIAISYDGTSVGSVSIDVDTGIANLTTASTLQSGAVRTVRITVADNDGELVGGRDLTLASVDNRINIGVPTVRTNLFGYADFTVTTGNVPAGSYDFTVTVDGRTIPLTLQVNP